MNMDENLENISDDSFNKHFKYLLTTICLVGIGYTCLTSGFKELKKNRDKIKNYEWVEKDLNRNGINEKYYFIDGERFFYEIDGKKLEDKFE